MDFAARLTLQLGLHSGQHPHETLGDQGSGAKRDTSWGHILMTLAQRSKQPGYAPPALPATGTNHRKVHMIREFLNTLPKLAGHPHWGSEHLWGGDTSPMGHPAPLDTQ